MFNEYAPMLKEIDIEEDMIAADAVSIISCKFYGQGAKAPKKKYLDGIFKQKYSCQDLYRYLPYKIAFVNRISKSLEEHLIDSENLIFQQK